MFWECALKIYLIIQADCRPLCLKLDISAFSGCLQILVLNLSLFFLPFSESLACEAREVIIQSTWVKFTMAVTMCWPNWGGVTFPRCGCVRTGPKQKNAAGLGLGLGDDTVTPGPLSNAVCCHEGCDQMGPN